MKSGLKAIVVLLILSTPLAAFAGPDNLVVKIRAATVALMIKHQDEEPFCSGVLAKGPDGKVYVWTAAHCCVPKDGTDVPRIGYAKDGTYESNSVTYIDLDDNGKDICRLTPAVKEKSPLRVGPETKDDTGMGMDGTVLLVTRQPDYIPDPEGICRLFIFMARLGISDIKPFHGYTVYNGVACPGMSGSPIVNNNGVITHIVSAYTFDKDEIPAPGVYGAPFDISEWFLDSLLNRKSRPLPKHLTRDLR